MCRRIVVLRTSYEGPGCRQDLTNFCRSSISKTFSLVGKVLLGQKALLPRLGLLRKHAHSAKIYAFFQNNDICEIQHLLNKDSSNIFDLFIDQTPLLETKYSRMDQVKFFKGCLPQILLGPFLKALSH